MSALDEQRAHELAELAARLTGERDRARSTAVSLEQELAHVTGARDALAKLLQAVHSRAPHALRAAEEALELELRAPAASPTDWRLP